MGDHKRDITPEHETSPNCGAAQGFVSFCSGPVWPGGGSYHGRRTVAVLRILDRSTARWSFASIADLRQARRWRR